MKPRVSTIFLRAALIVIVLVVLALCIFVLPMAFYQKGYSAFIPIVSVMYVTVIPFFIALYQASKLLNYIDQNTAFSNHSVQALKSIKNCAVCIAILYSALMPYIYFLGDESDAPGIIVMGLIIVFASIVIAVFSALLQKILRVAINLKLENDLTV
jgi:hypothetical protein